MEGTPFTLKCDAHSVKLNYDNGDHISIIKVFPDRKYDIKIVFGNHRLTINDEKRKETTAK